MNENGQPDNEQRIPPDHNDTPEQPNNPQSRRQYWQGVAWGCVPLVLFLAATAATVYGPNYSGVTYGIILLLVSLLAYIIVLIVAIVYLIKPEKRYLGYGLLTLVLAGPIISAISCTVLTRTY